MTLKAREVLSDCKSLLEDLYKEQRSDLWRPRWAGLVALLRSVGHVLDKVDGENSPEARDVVDSAWQELNRRTPEPKIFWDFIEEERNNILKLYAFGPRGNITIHPGGPTTFEFFMRSGEFKGKDPLQLCGEAIEFWEEYLADIDQ